MENTTVKAQGKYIRQSPYKMRLVLNLIRGLEVQDALNVLKEKKNIRVLSKKIFKKNSILKNYKKNKKQENFLIKSRLLRFIILI